jgi:hypothetical protein
LQRKSQLVPLQVGVPLTGASHGTHALPHEATELFATHCPLHAW